VKPADIAFINQETLLAGEEFGFSDYPQFNSPRKLGLAIAGAGFNVVNHATNHIMDKGEKAIIATMNFWDAIPQTIVLGIHRSNEQRSLPRLVEKNNITLGFLSYTYGTNGIPVPKDKLYLVSLINTGIMGSEIDALRPLCDVLVVSMHWGEEYRHDYNKNQETLAAFLTEHKVDVVIGHHPHVIQPIEYILRPDGRWMLCFYSLGNLISAQTQDPTLLGAMAYIKIGKIPAPDGETADGIILTDAGAIPLVTHYEKIIPALRSIPSMATLKNFLKSTIKTREKLNCSWIILQASPQRYSGRGKSGAAPFRNFPGFPGQNVNLTDHALA
jgi:poly-gamma-glutamate synthesis protein (capsule biosynthesis protein)